MENSRAGYYAADGRACLMAAETADLIVLNESIAKMLVRWHAVVAAGTRDQVRTKDPGRT